MRREPKFRCGTGKSIGKLSKILNVPNTHLMQDWEWEIAESDRINEYIELYKKDHMTDDDKFTIMETIIQALEDIYVKKGFPPKQWSEVKKLLSINKSLHQYTVYYWSCFAWYTPRSIQWKIAREMRHVYFGSYGS